MLETVAQQAARGVSGQVILVPELKSHEMERELCAVGGDTISRFAEVLSFTRLASRVFALTGGLAEPALEDAGRVLAMARAVDSVRAQLRHYSAVIAQPEYLTAFVALSDELKSYCVTPQALQDAAGLTGGSLAVKLEDLSLILSAYGAMCDQVGADPRDQMTRLCDRLAESDWAAGRHIYIDCFSFFSLQEQNVLEQLICRADQVTLCLTIEPEGGAIFDAARQTMQACKRLAQRHGKPYRSQLFPDLPRRDENLNLVQTGLLGGAAVETASPDDSVRTLVARDSVAACAWVASRIGDLVRSGVRYRDIAVTWPTGSGYETLLEAVLSDWEVPVNLTQKRDILQTPVCRLPLAALDVITGGWTRDDVLYYLKSGFSGLDLDDLDRLENYGILWNLRGRRWTRPFTAHPEGYEAESDPGPALERLNAVRQQGLDPVLEFEQALSQAGTTADQVLALYAFLERLDLAGQLQTRTDQLLALGRDQEALEYSQLYGVLIGALEQLYQVCGDLSLTTQRFARLLELVLSQYDVGAIPAVLDAVAAGELSHMRYRKPEHLFVLGAEEGLLPAYGSSDSLLSEAERAELLRCGVSLAPDAEHRLNQELLDVYMVLSSPSRSLAVLRTADAQASFVFLRLNKLCAPPETVSDPPPATLRLAAAAAVGGAPGIPEALDRCAADLPELTRVLDTLKRAAGYRLGLLSPEYTRALYGRDTRLTVSRLELWAACQFRHFCTYGLGLTQRQTAAFDAPAFGTFVHYVLEQLVRQVQDQGGFAELPEGVLEPATQALMDRYAAERLGGLENQEDRFRYLYGRNRQELLAIVRELGRELRVSDFLPTHFELRFGGQGAYPPIPIRTGTGTASLTGVVDRVDRLELNGEAWFRVVDYKTGRKTFSYSDLSAGMGLQMLVYLFALERFGLGKPAGVLYFPAHNRLLSSPQRLEGDALDQARQKAQARSGLLTQDPAVLAAMEHFTGQPSFLPLQLDKQGNLVGGKTGSLLDESRWTALKGFVQGKLIQAARGIAGGDVTPNPYTRGGTDTACAYCPYAAVCRLEGGPDRYLPGCTETEFWARLEGERHG